MSETHENSVCLTKEDVYELKVGKSKVDYVTLYRLREVVEELKEDGFTAYPEDDYPSFEGDERMVLEVVNISKLDYLFGEVLE